MNKFFLPLILLVACFIQAVPSSAEQVTLQIVRVQDCYNMLKAVAVRDPLQLYSEEMAADPAGCGILRAETPEGYSYTMIAGMEDQPMKELSQSQQDYYSHWLEQGCPEGEEELTSPLMMYGEHEKENPEQAKKKLDAEQQQQQRNRQATDKGESDSSCSEQRTQSSAAIKEESSNHQPPREISITTPLDDISEMTSDYTILESNQHSSSFSPKGGASNALLQKAKDKLIEAQVEVSAARQHFDFSQSQWKASKNLELTLKNHYELQQQLGLAYNSWQDAAISLRQPQAAAYDAWNRSDPSYADLNQAVITAETEVRRTFQAYQVALVQVQTASNHCFFVQQGSIQQGLIPGVDYTSVFNEAQLRANRAAAELDKCKEAVCRIKFKQPRVAKQKETGALPKKITATTALKEQGVEKASKSKAGELEKEVQGGSIVAPQRVETMSKSSTTASEKTSYKDQGTQISKEDLTAWKREALLKKQALWKNRFHKMVEKIKQLKEAVAADFSEQLLHEVSQEFVLNIAQSSLAEEGGSAVTLQMAGLLHEIVEKAEKIIAEKAEKIALAPTTVDELIEGALSASWTKKHFSKIAKQAMKEIVLEKQQAEEKLYLEKKERIFKRLFFSEGETTEREKLEQQQKSAASIGRAKERQCAEMEQFCEERVNLLRKEKEGGEKNIAEAPLVERAGDILTQCYRRPYEWCNDMVQLMQDQRIVFRETWKINDKFFADQGRRVIDVPTKEYAWKSGLVAQQLYKELVAKRRQEEAALKASPREREPRQELGYFEQVPIMLEGPVFRRFVESVFTGTTADFNRESDERALDYFKEIKKSNPRVFEFWKKSVEIEEQLKKERLEKAKEFIQQFPDREEALRVAQKWGIEWPERVQQEREQKKSETLARDLFAKEERRQRITQAVIDQKAAQEAEQQKTEKALLDQEAKGKVQKQNPKKNKSKKK